ncbi:MAG: D-glycero-beta-D-manno-heptose 1-phosphate adenylyltransferase [Candidatus Omnitrophota bacterium]
MKNKIIASHNKLKKVIHTLKKRNKKIVFTNGCFDLLHRGHIKYLAKAKQLGDYLIVAINSDESVKRIKGENRPLTNQKDRAEILSSLEMVDFVTIFGDSTPLRLIKFLKPDVLVKGADWKQKDIVGANFVKNYGGKVKRILYLKGFSTTNLIAKIAKAFKK